MTQIREQILDEARTWLLTPYHHQGRIKGVGVDCAMLLIEVYHACGLMPKYDPGQYTPDWHLHQSEELYLGHIKKFAHQVEVPKPGDAALFQFGRCISHGAIVVEWPVMIHSYIKTGCVLDDGTNGVMRGRLRAFYSFLED